MRSQKQQKPTHREKEMCGPFWLQEEDVLNLGNQNTETGGLRAFFILARIFAMDANNRTKPGSKRRAVIDLKDRPGSLPRVIIILFLPRTALIID